MKYKARIYQRFEFSHDLVRYLFLDRVIIEKDNVVLVTGKRGDGKTTLSLKLILGFNDLKKMEQFYNKENKISNEDSEDITLSGFSAFSMEHHLAFTQDKLMDLCKNLRKGFILSDEAVVNAGRRNSMTRANKLLHQIITINRKNYNTIFFCMPSVEDFDISILQYITHWIHIDDRGYAVVLLPNSKSIFGRKNWDVDKMKKIYDKFLEKHTSVSSVPYWLFDNYRGYIRFSKLGVRIEEKYLKIANEEKNKGLEKTKEEDKPRKRLSDEQTAIMDTIVKKLIDGKITDSADYYVFCSKLDFTKEKLNRLVNAHLIKAGDGRSATRIIKENKQKEDASYEKQIRAKKIIY